MCRAIGSTGAARVCGARWRGVRVLACLLALFAAAGSWAAEGKVYRCERGGAVVYTDIGCGLLPPVRLGRPVGTVDPLTEAERALLERMQRGTSGGRERAARGRAAQAHGGARAAAGAKAARCTATAGAGADCTAGPPPRRRAHAKGGKPRRVTSSPAPARSTAMYARPRQDAGPGPGASEGGVAGDARRLAPGRVAP